MGNVRPKPPLAADVGNLAAGMQTRGIAGGHRRESTYNGVHIPFVTPFRGTHRVAALDVVVMKRNSPSRNGHRQYSSSERAGADDSPDVSEDHCFKPFVSESQLSHRIP